MLTAEPDPAPGPARHRPGELVRPAATPATVMEVFTRAARQVRRLVHYDAGAWMMADPVSGLPGDRKSTRLNSSHVAISYAVFCLKKKTTPASFIHPAASTADVLHAS